MAINACTLAAALLRLTVIAENGLQPDEMLLAFVRAAALGSPAGHKQPSLAPSSSHSHVDVDLDTLREAAMLAVSLREGATPAGLRAAALLMQGAVGAVHKDAFSVVLRCPDAMLLHYAAGDDEEEEGEAEGGERSWWAALKQVFGWQPDLGEASVFGSAQELPVEAFVERLASIPAALRVVEAWMRSVVAQLDNSVSAGSMHMRSLALGSLPLLLPQWLVLNVQPSLGGWMPVLRIHTALWAARARCAAAVMRAEHLATALRPYLVPPALALGLHDYCASPLLMPAADEGSECSHVQLVALLSACLALALQRVGGGRRGAAELGPEAEQELVMEVEALLLEVVRVCLLRCTDRELAEWLEQAQPASRSPAGTCAAAAAAADVCPRRGRGLLTPARRQQRSWAL